MPTTPTPVPMPALAATERSPEPSESFSSFELPRGVEVVVEGDDGSKLCGPFVWVGTWLSSLVAVASAVWGGTVEVLNSIDVVVGSIRVELVVSDSAVMLKNEEDT